MFGDLYLVEFCISIALLYAVCGSFSWFRYCFSLSTSQEIGWEEQPRSNLYLLSGMYNLNSIKSSWRDSVKLVGYSQ